MKFSKATFDSYHGEVFMLKLTEKVVCLNVMQVAAKWLQNEMLRIESSNRQCHKCIVNLGLFRSGTTTLAMVAERLGKGAP